MCFNLNFVALLVGKHFDIFFSPAVLISARRPPGQGIYSSLTVTSFLLDYFNFWPSLNMADVVVNS